MCTYFGHIHTQELGASKITQPKDSDSELYGIPSLVVDQPSLILCQYNGR